MFELTTNQSIFLKFTRLGTAQYRSVRVGLYMYLLDAENDWFFIRILNVIFRVLRCLLFVCKFL